MIYGVYVSKRGLLYVCENTAAGFLCGQCQRGHIELKRGTFCKVCHAMVEEVLEIDTEQPPRELGPCP